MKREKAKGFIMGVICTVLVMSSVLGAAAATGMVDLQAAYRNIKITLNGSQLTPKDANGKVVEPFIVDGTTYLPVRAVSEALGLDVNWDGSTNTVALKGSTSANKSVINVANTAELKSALRKSDVEIHMAAGTYSTYDEFSMNQVSNVKLVGGDGVKLVNMSGADRILSLYGCDNISISGITMGHETAPGEYYCTAGVLGLYSSDNVSFENCDIYGCGTMAFETSGCLGVNFKNCYMHHCSDCIGSVDESTATLTDCRFEGNGYGEYKTDYAFYCLWGSTMTFTNCDFQDNYNPYFCYTGEDNDMGNTVKETGCTYSGNGWEPGPKG